MLLSVRGLFSGYSGSVVLQGVDIEVGDELVTIIGPNGAGKTTLLLTIAGLLKPHRGKVMFNGLDVTRMSCHERVKMGLVLCPERRRLFPRMTVGDNVMAGAFLRNDGDDVKRDLERAMEIFPIIRERWGQRAGTLSGGEQQMVAIARALMARPRLLMLDEPSVGLSPLAKAMVLEKVKELRETEGVSVLLVEQDAYAALEIADRAYVMESGRIAMEGETANLRCDEKIKNSYLGV